MDDELKETFSDGILAANKAFKILIEETDGNMIKMIFALASILSSMETQHPGTISDVEEGAKLLFNQHALEITMN
jgi:hypothetical protein